MRTPKDGGRGGAGTKDGERCGHQETWVRTRQRKNVETIEKCLKQFDNSFEVLPNKRKTLKKLQKVTTSYNKLQKVTKRYKKLHKVTKSYKKLHKVTKSYQPLS